MAAMKRMRIHSEENFRLVLETAVDVLRRGELIIFPAERLYGMGADAANSAAVQKIFALKGRTEKKPLPVIVGDVAAAEKVAVIPPPAAKLIERFWPGPLTLVLPVRAGVAPEVLAGGEEIGMRVPGNLFARELARLLGRPVTATSANWSGEMPCSSLEELPTEMDAEIELAVDAGRLPGPPASTVIRVSEKEVEILREGAVSRQEIKAVLENVIVR